MELIFDESVGQVPSRLIPPCGGTLVDLTVNNDDRAGFVEHAYQLPSLRLSERAICDLELLATGAFSPLDRFMAQADYERCLAEMRLANGFVFPVPVTLPVEADADIRLDAEICLRDQRNNLLAVMTVEEIFQWNPNSFSDAVLGTRDLRHPLNSELLHWGPLNISGPLRIIDLPARIDFQSLRLTPGATRARLEQKRRSDVLAFQTRNPLHRVHEEMLMRAAELVNGTILLHPAVGMNKPGDVNQITRVRSYNAFVENHCEADRTLLALIPLAMRMAGPREALWHMLIRRNFGANHFIVGRDHASPGLDSSGKPFYQPLAAQELATNFSSELDVSVIACDEMVFLPDENRYEEISKLETGKNYVSLSGTQVREEYLAKGRRLPSWYSRPEVADVLAEAFPPRERQGFCVWFTGLSGAGKSTIADILTIFLMERGRTVTLLDGDIVRTHLSKGLGFSKADRDANVLRIGFVASEIARHGGVSVCAAVSPYCSTRNEVRGMFELDNFIEIFVDTPLEVCEQRDTKGMYAMARRGEITGFTGIDDPYEAPDNAEIVIDTVLQTAAENARKIVDVLAQKGFIK